MIQEFLFKWLGVLAWFVLGGVGILVGLSLLMDSFRKLTEYNRCLLIERSLRDLGFHFQRNSYWFSEDRSAQTLMKLIGDQLADARYPEVSRLRDEWRAQTRNANAMDSATAITPLPKEKHE